MGWEPVETHRHVYDDAGRLMTTVVTREPEWDDVERRKMLALVEYESTICKCGYPEQIADEDPDLEMQFRVCPVCAGVAKALRMKHTEDREETKRLGEEPPPDADLPDDGRYPRLVPKPKS